MNVKKIIDSVKKVKAPTAKLVNSNVTTDLSDLETWSDEEAKALSVSISRKSDAKLSIGKPEVGYE